MGWLFMLLAVESGDQLKLKLNVSESGLLAGGGVTGNGTGSDMSPRTTYLRVRYLGPWMSSQAQ
jgi:hypothetical protein